MNNWSLVFKDYKPEHESFREAICSIGNGYFTTRAASAGDSADTIHYPGTYLAGGYNRVVTRIAGRDLENEDLVNLPNWLPLSLRIGDGPWLRIDDVEILDYRQSLEMRDGVLLREIRFRDNKDRITHWHERRLVSMAEPHQAMLHVAITPENWSSRVTLESAIDGSVTNCGVERYKDLNGQHLETLKTKQLAGDTILLHSRTNQSRLEIALATRTRVYQNGEEVAPGNDPHTRQEQDWVGQQISCELVQGRTTQLDKALALYTSRDPAISEVCLAAEQTVARMPAFETMLGYQRESWGHLWDEFDIDLECEDPETLLKLRVHVFHLLQTISPHTIEYDTSAPARGWHGEAYRGHIFWDELFIFPFLNLRQPVITRALLRYRYRRLPAARHAARDAGFNGAMFPWQSGSDGREETQRMHLNPRSGQWISDNSHRQRHINAAIAYNVWRYYQVTDDHEFLYFYGAEILLEIARFWHSISTYNKTMNRYEIRGVMGPDEYHTAYPGRDPQTDGGVNNNAYTNVMAAWCLMRAFDALALLPRDHCKALCERLHVNNRELDQWQHMSYRMFVPFHEDDIISQFEGFENLKEFDWAGYRREYGDIARLDRILEKEGDTPNRYKVAKQPDVLMLFYLFSAEEVHLMFEHLGYPLHEKSIARNVDYYLERTSDGSTLSFVGHAWVLNRYHLPGAWPTLQQALDSDIADIQGGTTAEGIHLGAMAGSVDIMHRCVLGIEARSNILHFDPVLPEQLHRLAVLLRYRRHKLDVSVDHGELTIKSREATAAPISVAYRGQIQLLVPGRKCTFILLGPRYHRTT